MKESRLAEESDRISILTEQLEVYKKMNEESKQQFAENDKQRKQEISQFEKKAHSNWVIASLSIKVQFVIVIAMIVNLLVRYPNWTLRRCDLK